MTLPKDFYKTFYYYKSNLPKVLQLPLFTNFGLNVIQHNGLIQSFTNSRGTINRSRTMHQFVELWLDSQVTSTQMEIARTVLKSLVVELNKVNTFIVAK